MTTTPGSRSLIQARLDVGAAQPADNSCVSTQAETCGPRYSRAATGVLLSRHPPAQERPCTRSNASRLPSSASDAGSQAARRVPSPSGNCSGTASTRSAKCRPTAGITGGSSIPDAAGPGKTYARHGGFLAGVALRASTRAFFGLSTREASSSIPSSGCCSNPRGKLWRTRVTHPRFAAPRPIGVFVGGFSLDNLIDRFGMSAAITSRRAAPRPARW